MMSSFRCRILLIVPLALLGFTSGVSLASDEPVKEEVPDLLPLSLNTATGGTARPVRTHVEWDGLEYDVESGIDVLMSVVRDPKKSAEEHEHALIGLMMLGRQLQGRPCLDELAGLYDNGRCSEKSGILTCFLGSRDPRGIPVFIKALDKEEYTKLRLSAASALAGWNVRRGVAELVNLVDSREIIRSRMPYVRDNALDRLRNLSIRKGWGFSDRAYGLLESIFGGTDLSDEEKRTLYRGKMNARIRKWFAENEHCFPEWKPGDPLPGDVKANVVVAELPPCPPHLHAVREVEGDTGRDALDTLPMSTDCARNYLWNDPPATVSWEGQVYDAADAIRVLMDVGSNMDADIWQRERGLDFLRVFDYRLRGNKCIEDLLTLYSQAPTGFEKATILACLSVSEDPRAIPLFHTVLTAEKDHVLRLFAASGLVRWNIRAGVKELIRLLECGRSLRVGLHNSVREEASFVLRNFSAAKAWGFPHKEVTDYARRSTENRVQFRAVLIKRWEEWFQKNEHRFPEWNPGDTLPEDNEGDKGGASKP